MYTYLIVLCYLVIDEPPRGNYQRDARNWSGQTLETKKQWNPSLALPYLTCTADRDAESNLRSSSYPHVKIESGMNFHTRNLCIQQAKVQLLSHLLRSIKMNCLQQSIPAHILDFKGFSSTWTAPFSHSKDREKKCISLLKLYTHIHLIAQENLYSGKGNFQGV